MQIDTIDRWHEVARQLSERGYSLFQTQYDIDDPKGFVARFMVNESEKVPQVELVTRSAVVRDAMLRYKL